MSHERCILICLIALAGCGAHDSSSAGTSSGGEVPEAAAAEVAPVSGETETSESTLVTPSPAADPGLLEKVATGGAERPSAFKTVTVRVALSDGKMVVDTPLVNPARRILFEVRNGTDETRRVVVVETSFAPDNLPVQDGRVRYFTYFDEPHTMLIHHRGGFLEQVNRVSQPARGSYREEPGVKVLPGQTITYKDVCVYDAEFASGTAFVIFCNDPGHYERGEYAGVVIK